MVDEKMAPDKCNCKHHRKMVTKIMSDSVKYLKNGFDEWSGSDDLLIKSVMYK